MNLFSFTKETDYARCDQTVTLPTLLVPGTEPATAGIDCKMNMVYKTEESLRGPRRRRVLS